MFDMLTSPYTHPLKRLIWMRLKAGARAVWDTISGNPVSFTARNAPLRQLEVAFSPVQDLHGYDAPWPAGGGVNLFDISTAITNGPISSYGITEISIDSNGKVHIIGTSASSVSSFSLGVIKAGDANAQQLLGKGYTLSTWDVTGGTIYNCWGFRTDTENTFAISMANPGNGVSFDLSFKPMVSNGAASAWTPYSNECPISGWSSLTVEQRGVNLWDEEWEVGSIYDETGANNNNVDTLIRSKNYIPASAETTYYAQLSNGNAHIFCYNAEKTYIGYVDRVGSGTFTTLANTAYIRFRMNIAYGTTYKHDVSINYPATDTDYTPYNPLSRSISISLGQTVYSGYVDVISGVGEIDWVGIDGGSLEWTKANNNNYRNFVATPSPAPKRGNDPSTAINAICSIYKSCSFSSASQNDDNYIWVTAENTNPLAIKDTSKAGMTKAEFTECMTGVTIVYRLATPIPFTLTPQEVQSLAGDNTMWSDANGDLTVEYRSN